MVALSIFFSCRPQLRLLPSPRRSGPKEAACRRSLFACSWWTTVTLFVAASVKSFNHKLTLKSSAKLLSPEVIECPLCSGEGELTRAEILERLGVRDFARVAQLSAEEAFRLLQGKHDREHQSGWSRFETELTKDELRLAISEKETLFRRVEG